MDFILDDILIWSDPSILVVNKPSGLLTLPDGYDPSLPHLKSVLEPHFGPLWIVHRLDRETSGVLLMARHASAHRHLNTQFQEQKVTKIYHAIVVGTPPWEKQTIAYPLRPDGDRRHRTIVDEERGKPALSEAHVLRRYDGYSLVEVVPKTGRTHQIRVHLARVGHPVAADPLYGDKTHPAHHLLPRLGLHAWAVVFEHPDTARMLYFNSPYPRDFSTHLIPPPT